MPSITPAPRSATQEYDGSGMLIGGRAVRWDASGTAATELGNLGTDASDVTQSSAVAINDAGIAIGYAGDYDDFGTISARGRSTVASTAWPWTSTR